MVKCWASVLGGCGVQSREHYLSKGLWDSDSITVRGLWEIEKTIGLNSLTAKNLCKTHNEALSPLDTEAAKIFRTIHEIYRLQEVRRNLKPSKHWTVQKYEVNGILFERWAAKFLVGLFYVIGKEGHWHRTGSGPLDPPAHIIEAIFGRKTFNEPFGLYCSVKVGDKVDPGEPPGVGLEPLFHLDDHGLIGAVLFFRGIRFIIWLDAARIQDLSSAEGANAIYHLRQANYTIGNVPSQVMNFDWQT